MNMYETAILSNLTRLDVACNTNLENGYQFLGFSAPDVDPGHQAGLWGEVNLLLAVPFILDAPDYASRLYTRHILFYFHLPLKNVLQPTIKEEHIF